MNNTLSMLEQLQAVAVAALAADPMFSGQLSANTAAVPIILERANDIETQIESAVGSVGICALVTTPLFEFFNEELYELSGWAYPVVDIFENVPVNQGQAGTQIRAIALASRVLAILHRYPTGLATGPTQRVPSFIGMKRPLALTSQDPLLKYSVSFQAHVLLP